MPLCITYRWTYATDETGAREFVRKLEARGRAEFADKIKGAGARLGICAALLPRFFAAGEPGEELGFFEALNVVGEAHDR